MFKKVIGILVVFSFIVFNAVTTCIPTYAKWNAEEIAIDVNAEKSETESEKEELRLVELEEFLISSSFLIYASDRSITSFFPTNSRLNLSPYFCLPYPPPNA